MLSPAERDYRARFALEACAIMRERLVPTDVFRHFGMDVEEGRRCVMEAGQLAQFRNLLFARIVPNLRRVGLLTDAVIPGFEALGLMAFADLPSDGEADWETLAAPLPTRPRLSEAGQ